MWKTRRRPWSCVKTGEKNPEQQQNIRNTGAKNGNVEPFTLIKNKIEVNTLSVKLDPKQK